MLVVQQSGIWGQVIQSLFGREVDIQVRSPDEIRPADFAVSRMIALQYHPICIDWWLSLFDKNGFTLDNRMLVLLDAPQCDVEQSWCRELGFQELVRDLASLTQLVDRWKYRLRASRGMHSLVDEFRSRIPWSETTGEAS